MSTPAGTVVGEQAANLAVTNKGSRQLSYAALVVHAVAAGSACNNRLSVCHVCRHGISLGSGSTPCIVGSCLVVVRLLQAIGCNNRQGASPEALPTPYPSMLNFVVAARRPSGPGFVDVGHHITPGWVVCVR